MLSPPSRSPRVERGECGDVSSADLRHPRGWSGAVLMGAVLMALIGGTNGCRLDATGKPCTDDEQCGPGVDCYPRVCHVVCTRAEDCPSGLTCQRYRCLPGEAGRPIGPGGSPSNAPNATSGKSPAAHTLITPAPRPTAATPVPGDATTAELRALRREVELIRRDLDALLKAQGVTTTRPPSYPHSPEHPVGLPAPPPSPSGHAPARAPGR